MANQRTQIYLEGVALDLDKNVDIDFTYSIADISDFEKRTTTFSKTIVLPATAHNNFLLGNYFDFNINNAYSNTLDNVGVNYNPLKKAFAKVTLDNVEIFAGVLRLLEITSKNGEIQYQCALFGSLGGLFSTLGESLLTDLDLDALDHTYNTTTIQTSWNTSDVVAQGFVYANTNYGINVTESGATQTYDVRNFRPAVSVKRIFDEIISQAGYTYTGTFWNSNNLDKLILLNGEEKFTAFYNSFCKAMFDTRIGAGTIGLASAVYQNGLNINTTTERITNTTSDSLNVKLNFSFDIHNELPIWTFAEAGFYQYTSAGVYKTSLLQPVWVGVGTDYNYSFNTTITLEPNEYLVFSLNITDILGGSVTTTAFTIKNTSYIQIDPVANTSKSPVLYNSTILGKSIVPEGIKQAEFIKNIINLLNLYIIQDPDNEFNLTFIPQPDFYINQSVDWTDKKDLAKGFSIKPSTEFTPKSYSFKYKDDVDYYSKTYKNKYADAYGNLKYDTENEFSKDDIATEFFFSLAPIANAGRNDRLMAQLYDLNPDGSYKQVKCNPKLAFWGGKKATGFAYNITDGATTILNSGIAYYGYTGHIYNPTSINTGSLDDLCFGIPKEVYFGIPTYPTLNLYYFFYKQFIDSQNNKDSKLITLYFLLNSIDIMNLSFQKYIRVDNGIYYLNKIDGYNPLANELTKVELLRIVALEELDAYVTYTPSPIEAYLSYPRVTLDRTLPFNKSFNVQWRFVSGTTPYTGTQTITITAGNLYADGTPVVSAGVSGYFSNILITPPTEDAGYIYVYGGDYTTD